MLIQKIQDLLHTYPKKTVVTEHHSKSSQKQRSITAASLNENATSLALTLQTLPLSNRRIIVILDAGIDFVTTLFACLYSGTVIIPCPPPKSAQDMRRLHNVILDSTAELLICQTSHLNRFKEACPQISCISFAELLAKTNKNNNTQLHIPDPNQTAIIQYSSGSTAAPKGVLVTQNMISHNHAIVAKRWCLSSKTRGLTWLPHWHDMGLFGGILYPILSGGWILTLSPIEFVKRPLNWLKLISEHQITLSGGPPFAYDLVLALAQEHDLSLIDLSSWQTAYCGADYIPRSTFKTVNLHLIPLGLPKSAFFACYGMAEITLFAGGEPYTSDVKDYLLGDTQYLLPCYIPSNDQQLRIFNVDAPEPSIPGSEGEICFSSQSALSTYLNSPANEFTYANQRWVRSGDYGYIDKDLLYITGRLKDIVKVRGKTLFPIDLAILANEHFHNLNPLVFYMGFDRLDITGDLIFLIEHKGKDTSVYNTADIRHLQQVFIEAYGVFIPHIYILPRGKIPKTTSGKVNRSAIDVSFINALTEMG